MRKENTDSNNNERVTEGLIQSRSIDHLLCGDDGNSSKNMLPYSFDNFCSYPFLKYLY